MSVKTFPKSVPPAEMLRHRRAWRLAENLFRVFGRQGNEYLIPVVDGCPRCPCERGRRMRECFHALLVMLRLQREEKAAARPPRTRKVLGELAGIADLRNLQVLQGAGPPRCERKPYRQPDAPWRTA